MTNLDSILKSRDIICYLSIQSCSPMDCSTPGFPVHHQLPELSQPQVHQISDAIQPSHPLSSPSPAFLSPEEVMLLKCGFREDS